MPQNRKLKPEDRDFLALVTQAIFANPFTDERVDIDLQLTGVSPKTPDGERVSVLTDVVTDRVNRIEQGEPLNIAHFTVLLSVPIFSMVSSSSSLDLKKIVGSRLNPTPPGVPVPIISPGSSVTDSDINDMTS